MARVKNAQVARKTGLPRAVYGKPEPESVPSSQSTESGTSTPADSQQSSNPPTPLLSQTTERELRRLMGGKLQAIADEMQAALERKHERSRGKPGARKLKRLTASTHWISGRRRAPRRCPPVLSRRHLGAEAERKVCTQLEARKMIMTHNGFLILNAGVRKFENAWAQVMQEELIDAPDLPQPDLTRPPPIPLDHPDEVYLEAAEHIRKRSQNALSLFIEEVVRDSITLAERKKASIVNAVHVLRALKACGRDLFKTPA